MQFIVFLRSNAPREDEVLKCSVRQRGAVRCGLD